MSGAEEEDEEEEEDVAKDVLLVCPNICLPWMRDDYEPIKFREVCVYIAYVA